MGNEKKEDGRVSKYIHNVPLTLLLEVFQNSFDIKLGKIVIESKDNGVTISANTPYEPHSCLTKVLFTDYETKILKMVDEMPAPTERLHNDYLSAIEYLVDVMENQEFANFWEDYKNHIEKFGKNKIYQNQSANSSDDSGQVGRINTKYIHNIPLTLLLDIFQKSCATGRTGNKKIEIESDSDGITIGELSGNSISSKVRFTDFDVQILEGTKNAPNNSEELVEINFFSVIDYFVKNLRVPEFENYWKDWDNAHKDEFKRMDVNQPSSYWKD